MQHQHPAADMSSKSHIFQLAALSLLFLAFQLVPLYHWGLLLPGRMALSLSEACTSGGFIWARTASINEPQGAGTAALALSNAAQTPCPCKQKPRSAETESSEIRRSAMEVETQEGVSLSAAGTPVGEAEAEESVSLPAAGTPVEEAEPQESVLLSATGTPVDTAAQLKSEGRSGSLVTGGVPPSAALELCANNRELSAQIEGAKTAGIIPWVPRKGKYLIMHCARGQVRCFNKKERLFFLVTIFQ